MPPPATFCASSGAGTPAKAAAFGGSAGHDGAGSDSSQRRRLQHPAGVSRGGRGPSAGDADDLEQAACGRGDSRSALPWVALVPIILVGLVAGQLPAVVLTESLCSAPCSSSRWREH
uniref:Uncharacterized protein n=1 Tax=Setaria italica TaxID=4555 RepID=K3YL38_SETIT